MTAPALGSRAELRRSLRPRGSWPPRRRFRGLAEGRQCRCPCAADGGARRAGQARGQGRVQPADRGRPPARGFHRRAVRRAGRSGRAARPSFAAGAALRLQAAVRAALRDARHQARCGSALDGGSVDGRRRPCRSADGSRNGSSPSRSPCAIALGAGVQGRDADAGDRGAGALRRLGAASVPRARSAIATGRCSRCRTSSTSSIWCRSRPRWSTA